MVIQPAINLLRDWFTLKELMIVQCASWLCLYNNDFVTPPEVSQQLAKRHKEITFTTDEICKCLDLYTTLGGCSSHSIDGHKKYHFLVDLDDDKRILFPDRTTFFYAKDRDTFNEWKGLLFQQIKVQYPHSYRNCLIT